jgi:hypothetical protein
VSLPQPVKLTSRAHAHKSASRKRQIDEAVIG